MVGNGGSWGDRGSPKKSLERSSLSRAKQSRLYGRSNSYILRTNIDNKTLKTLTTRQSAVTASKGESLKFAKVDPVAIPVCSIAVIVEYT